MSSAAPAAATAAAAACAANPCIFVVGRTGDGKSSVCNLLAMYLGAETPPFETSASAESHTHQPMAITLDGVTIVDTPGLQDSQGTTKDAKNIRKIVTTARERKTVSLFILVFNGSVPRCDSGLQDAVKLLVDSFGLGFLDTARLVFTRVTGKTVKGELPARAENFCEQIRQRLGLPQPLRLRHFVANSKLEDLEASDEIIAQYRAETQQNLRDLVALARSHKPLDTTQSVFGEYEAQRKQREADERAKKAADDKAAAEAKACEADARTKKLEEETAAAKKLAAEAEERRAQEARQNACMQQQMMQQMMMAAMAGGGGGGGCGGGGCDMFGGGGGEMMGQAPPMTSAGPASSTAGPRGPGAQWIGDNGRVMRFNEQGRPVDAIRSDGAIKGWDTRRANAAAAAATKKK